MNASKGSKVFVQVPLSKWQRAAVAIVPVIAASLVGQWATYPNLVPWYATLAKPAFNPPNWIFAPVWTVLYGLMALAVWRLLNANFPRVEKRTALALFFSQLVLNALWSVLFFGFHSPLGGLLNIVPQWTLIVLAIFRLRHIDSIAALCLCPLALWVGFAAVLNFEIWRLNG
jgi:tryptophan-rich sensory protein